MSTILYQSFYSFYVSKIQYDFSGILIDNHIIFNTHSVMGTYFDKCNNFHFIQHVLLFINFF